MTAGKLRLVVAGAGAFGREHLRSLAGMDEVVIAGVADIDLAAAEDAVARFGAESAGTDAAEMIERLRPDGFVVVTPGHTHVALASAALRLDIPVLLEKPVGLTAADADALIAAERDSRAFVLPGHILRFSEHYRMLAEIVRAGEIGRVLSVTSRNHRDDVHAVRHADIDPVLMTAVHDIDLAIWITGARLDSVLAIRRPEGTFRSETLITATDRHGSAWHISNAWTYPTADALPDRVEIVGERGSAELELGRSIRVFAARSREIALPQPDDMLRAEQTYFCRCIAEGRRPEVVTLADARLGLEACDAILESLRTGTLARA